MSKLLKSPVPFGMVPNTLLNDNSISLKAKGLFAFMQSKPEGWHFSAKMIAAQSKESIDSVSSGLKELENYGYLVREKKQTSKGFATIYRLLFDSEILQKPITENPILENPILENPMLGKSLNNSNKEISNKEISNKEIREGALNFLEINFPSEFERLMMQFKKQITDWNYFEEKFEATYQTEGKEYGLNTISGRFKSYALTWIHNQQKFDNKVIDLNANVKKEKIGGF
jgi:hypothetical protein